MICTELCLHPYLRNPGMSSYSKSLGGYTTTQRPCHRGQASAQRLRQAWPNAHLVHLPVHASWLDQSEIYFSAVQRKVIIPNDFTDLDQIADQSTY